MDDWNDLLENAKADGLKYAQDAIKAGATIPPHSPLSGEWADSISPKDVVNSAAVADDAYGLLDECEITELCDAWEEGYFSANWSLV